MGGDSLSGGILSLVWNAGPVAKLILLVLMSLSATVKAYFALKLMLLDGTSTTQITSGTAESTSPSWSPRLP